MEAGFGPAVGVAHRRPRLHRSAPICEQAPEVAVDQATVTATGITVKLKREDAFPPGTFTNCIKTKEFSALEKGSVEFKYYCPDVALGIVMVEEHHGSILVSELTAGGDPLKFRTVPKR